MYFKNNNKCSRGEQILKTCYGLYSHKLGKDILIIYLPTHLPLFKFFLHIIFLHQTMCEKGIFDQNDNVL